MGGRGFPTILYLDSEGEIIGRPSDRSIPAFRAMAGSLTEVAELAAKENRTQEEEVRYFEARITLGRLKLEEAKEIAAALPKQPAEAAARITAALNNLEIQSQLDAVTSQKEAEAAGAVFAAMAKEGRTPSGGGLTAARFWLIIIEHARAAEDVAMFERAFTEVKTALGEEDRYKGLYEQLANGLAELKGEGGN
ncbi:MAG: hypothetical protein AAF628_22205 [Planctomycetota bacterium]